MIRAAVRIGRRNLATAAPAAGGSDSQGLRLTFGTPHQPIYTNHAINGLNLPGDDSYYSVLPNRIPLIGQLKSGLVTIYHTNGQEEKFFVSGGFAFNRENNTAVDYSLFVDLFS